MRTLVISDLHLGARARGDVLRREPVRQVLLAALRDVDRLVLLGDTVELLEGRPRVAMGIAEPVLQEIGAVLGPKKEVVVVAGNHDHLLMRPWLRAQREQGKSLGLASRVPVSSGPMLQRLCGALAPAKVQVRYPGVWLGDRIWATHGHYLDRHLVREQRGRVGRAMVRAVPERGATAWHYETASTMSLAGVSGLLATNVPVVGEPLDRAAGITRSVAAAVLPLGRPAVAKALAPVSSGVLGLQFRRVGLPAMAQVTDRLNVRADHVIFGHLHRSGPRWDDPAAEWAPGLGRRSMVNSGCWVYEPLLLSGAEPPHPYWPGGAVLVEDGRPPRAVGLLDGIDDELLR